MSKKIALTLDSEAFNAFKQDFQQILNSTLSTMQQKEVEDASITAKFDINLQAAGNPNVGATDSYDEREITIPIFKHKIVASMKIKAEKSGYVGGPDYELVWDRASNAFAMKPVSDNQTSIFDAGYDYGEIGNGH